MKKRKRERDSEKERERGREIFSKKPRYRYISYLKVTKTGVRK